MSLQLVSNFSNKIETIINGEGGNWFKSAHMGKFLGLPQIEKSLVGLDRSKIPTRNDKKAAPHGTGGCQGPKSE